MNPPRGHARAFTKGKTAEERAFYRRLTKRLDQLDRTRNGQRHLRIRLEREVLDVGSYDQEPGFPTKST